MRYDGWDVILFPKESHIPIQEFKTACYVSPDECKWPAFRSLQLSATVFGASLTLSHPQMDANYQL